MRQSSFNLCSCLKYALNISHVLNFRPVISLHRKEVLKRLLLLNHERFEEEVAQGLHKKQDVETYYQQKGMPIPEGTLFSDQKGSTNKRAPKKAKNKTVQEPQSQYGLFGEESTQISD